MDNGQKAIMIGVSLFITIIIISAVLLIVNLGTGLTDDAAKEIGAMSTSLQKQLTEKYNNKVVSGTEVRSVVQQYLNSTEVTVVITKKFPTDDYYINVGVVGKHKWANRLVQRYISDNDNIYKISTNYISNANARQNYYTSMSAFDNINNAGRVYIDKAKKYKAYLIKPYSGNDRNNVLDVVLGVAFEPIDE